MAKVFIPKVGFRASVKSEEKMLVKSFVATRAMCPHRGVERDEKLQRINSEIQTSVMPANLAGHGTGAS